MVMIRRSPARARNSCRIIASGKYQTSLVSSKPSSSAPGPAEARTSISAILLNPSSGPPPVSDATRRARRLGRVWGRGRAWWRSSSSSMPRCSASAMRSSSLSTWRSISASAPAGPCAIADGAIASGFTGVQAGRFEGGGMIYPLSRLAAGGRRDRGGRRRGLLRGGALPSRSNAAHAYGGISRPPDRLGREPPRSLTGACPSAPSSGASTGEGNADKDAVIAAVRRSRLRTRGRQRGRRASAAPLRHSGTGGPQ